LNPILTVLPILVDEERSIVSELRSLDHNRSALVDQMSKIIEQLRETDEKRTPLMQRLDHLRELKQEVIMGNQSFQN
jgi:thymidylate synthase